MTIKAIARLKATSVSLPTLEGKRLDAFLESYGLSLDDFGDYTSSKVSFHGEETEVDKVHDQLSKHLGVPRQFGKAAWWTFPKGFAVLDARYKTLNIVFKTGTAGLEWLLECLVEAGVIRDAHLDEKSRQVKVVGIKSEHEQGFSDMLASTMKKLGISNWSVAFSSRL